MLDRMKYLVDILNEYSRTYYFTNEPTVSDAEFDALLDELKSLEEQTGVVLTDSPTHRVGGEVPSGFLPYTHLNRLWSLDKVKSVDELREWKTRCDKYRSGSSDSGFPVRTYVSSERRANCTHGSSDAFRLSSRSRSARSYCSA